MLFGTPVSCISVNLMFQKLKCKCEVEEWIEVKTIYLSETTVIIFQPVVPTN